MVPSASPSSSRGPSSRKNLQVIAGAILSFCCTLSSTIFSHSSGGSFSELGAVRGLDIGTHGTVGARVSSASRFNRSASSSAFRTSSFPFAPPPPTNERPPPSSHRGSSSTLARFAEVSLHVPSRRLGTVLLPDHERSPLLVPQLAGVALVLRSRSLSRSRSGVFFAIKKRKNAIFPAAMPGSALEKTLGT